MGKRAVLLRQNAPSFWLINFKKIIPVQKLSSLFLYSNFCRIVSQYTLADRITNSHIDIMRAQCYNTHGLIFILLTQQPCGLIAIVAAVPVILFPFIFSRQQILLVDRKE